jgi:prepilin-type N-terminal cleavage/methylation domain-containing protein
MNIFKSKNSILQTFLASPNFPKENFVGCHCPARVRAGQGSSKCQKFSRTRGFTLIELLVVISIIGFLSSVVLASMQTARDKAKGVAFRASVNEFIKAVKLMQSDVSTLPINTMFKTEAGWVAPSSQSFFINNNFDDYIADFPKPPFTGYFFYHYSEGYPCDDSPYMLLISGAQNWVFFSDWIVWYDDSDYKCYPLQ